MSTEDEDRPGHRSPEDAGAVDEPEETPDAPGMPSLGDLGSIAPLSGLTGLFGQARDQLEEAAEEAGNVVVTGRAGGGSVEIEMTGNLDAIAVRIDPEVVDPADVAMLEDLVLAALRHALSDALEVREQAASSVFPPSLDLGAMMQGLFGGFGGLGGLGGPAAQPGASPTADDPGATGGAGLLGAFGASMPGMPAGIGDLMNELFGPDGPMADLGFEPGADEAFEDEDEDEAEDEAEDTVDEEDLGEAPGHLGEAPDPGGEPQADHDDGSA